MPRPPLITTRDGRAKKRTGRLPARETGCKSTSGGGFGHVVAGHSSGKGPVADFATGMLPLSVAPTFPAHAKVPRDRESVAAMGKQKGETPLPENESVDVERIIALRREGSAQVREATI